MKKTFIWISYILLAISVILFGIVNFNQIYNFSYLFALIFFIILFLQVYISGIIFNTKENYKRNINIYIVLYFFLLCSLTIFISRSSLSFDIFNKDNLNYYLNGINLIPFKTIVGFITSNSALSVTFYNIIGNLVALMPLTILLIIKDKKNDNIKSQIKYLFISVLLVETLQFLTSTGRFDIDDFILNIGGSLLLLYIIRKLKISDKIRNLFYKDFKLKNKFKYIISSFISLLIIVVDIIIVTELIDSNKYKDNNQVSFYVYSLDNCLKMSKVKVDDYNLYLNCVDVYYEQNNIQMDIKEALSSQLLTRNQIKENLNFKYTLYDGGTEIYKNVYENISVILCNTLCGNKDIYIGYYSMEYEENMCK